MDKIQEAWNKFFGSGWPVSQTPSKRECFDAGWKACVEHMKEQVVIVTDEMLDAHKESALNQGAYIPGSIHYRANVPKRNRS